jgi:hypothetical protein
MKEILYSVALALVAGTSIAQDTEPTRTTFLSVNFCSDYDTIVVDLLNNYNETLLFHGEGVTTHMNVNDVSTDLVSHTQVFVNQTTGTWSLVQVYNGGITCYLTGGTRFEPYVD